MSKTEPDARLDCRGLFCPEPVIRTAEQVRGMKAGEILEVLGTDPGLVIDIPAYCLSQGHTFLGCERREGLYACSFKIRGGEGPVA